MPKDPLWQKDIEISWNVLSNNKINAKAQKDVIRRNEKWEKSEFDLFLSPDSLVNLLQSIPIILLRNTPVSTGPRHTWMFDQRHAMRKMHDALFLQFDFVDSDSVSMLPVSKKRFLPPERRKKAIASLGLDLCLISADAFFAGLRRHSQHKHRYSEEFSFSMCMLDRVIEDALAEEDEETKKQILTKLPTEYHNFANVFSKVESSAFPPHRPIDHKVELLPDTALFKAHPLYSMLAN
jgi:hypothetical protein